MEWELFNPERFHLLHLLFVEIFHFVHRDHSVSIEVHAAKPVLHAGDGNIEPILNILSQKNKSTCSNCFKKILNAIISKYIWNATLILNRFQMYIKSIWLSGSLIVCIENPSNFPPSFTLIFLGFKLIEDVYLFLFMILAEHYRNSYSFWQ